MAELIKGPWIVDADVRLRNLQDHLNRVEQAGCQVFCVTPLEPPLRNNLWAPETQEANQRFVIVARQREA